jgi:hypothetical protein
MAIKTNLQLGGLDVVRLAKARVPASRTSGDSLFSKVMIG